MSTKNGTTKRKPASPRLPATVKPASAKPVPAKPAAVAKPGKKNKKANAKKEAKAITEIKVIRESFTMPQNDYAKIAELKEVCLKVDLHVKKSELLRAGLHALGKLSAAQLKRTIAQMEQVKTGRPKKD